MLSAFGAAAFRGGSAMSKALRRPRRAASQRSRGGAHSSGLSSPLAYARGCAPPRSQLTLTRLPTQAVSWPSCSAERSVGM